MNSELFKKLYSAFDNAQWINGGTKGKVNYSVQADGKDIIILFQQSNHPFDWLCNLFFFPKKVVPYKNMDTEFKVHKGFWIQFDSIRDDILTKVTELLSEDTENIYIYGWSLGGRLAMFCKEMLAYNYNNLNRWGKITCITIGSPRGFCKTKDWDHIKERFDNCIRYTNGSDIVTRLPFKWLGLLTPFTHEVSQTHVGDNFNWFKVCKTGTDHLNTEYYHNITE